MDSDHFALRLISERIRPAPPLTVSEWADRYRWLSGKASSEEGPWRTARNELLREPMDALSLYAPGERVVIMKPGQGGGTEIALNWLLYIMDHVQISKPAAVFVPTDQLRDNWVLQRLRPAVDGVPRLRAKLNITKSRDGSNRLDMIDYPGGVLFMLAAGAGSNLESRPVCFVVLDELDRFPADVSGRGDPRALIATRQSTFPRRKTLEISTPEIDGASAIQSSWEESDQRERWVACPHCGARQVLIWEHLQWTPDLSRAWYVCAESGCVIEERDKPALLAPGAGEWRPRHPERTARARGYHWNSLYNPIGLGYSWLDLVRQWVKAQGHERALQVFLNERLAQPYRDQRTAIQPDELAARAEPYPLREIQPGAGLLTAGVDVQDDRLAVQIVGWGPGGAWWVLDYVEIPGDPGRPEVWVALTDLLGRALGSSGGVQAGVEATAIDMGGHHTEAVKAFVRTTRLPRCLAILGSRYRLNVVLSGPRKVDYTAQGRVIRHGMRYHQVGTELAKDALYHALRTDADHPPSERRAHYPRDLVPPLPEPSPWLAGLTSEVWNPRRHRYEPKRGQGRGNEPLDTWVYAYAAAHHPEIRLDRLRASDWAARLRRFGFAGPAAPPKPETKPADSETPAASPETPPPDSPLTAPPAAREPKRWNTHTRRPLVR